MHDISSFMSWFVSQCVSIFSWFFSTLDSIRFSGTSLLKVIFTILILSSLLPVLLTLVSNTDRVVSRVERYKSKSRKEDS